MKKLRCKRRIGNWEQVINQLQTQYSLFDLRPLFQEFGHKKVKKMGQFYKISCPFHLERDPSLVIFPKGFRTWHCFGCGKGKIGSIIDYYMERKEVSVFTAVIKLSRFFKIKLKWEDCE
jgi:DNA primase